MVPTLLFLLVLDVHNVILVGFLLVLAVLVSLLLLAKEVFLIAV